MRKSDIQKQSSLKVVKVRFGAHRRTVREVLANARKDDLKEVIVLGYDTQNRPTMFGGSMRNSDLLWLLEWARGEVGPHK